MADIRDPAMFMRGRWAWNQYGYEAGFPRKCAFTDVDAVVEFDSRALFIESKYHDGRGPCDYPDVGQMILLRRLLEISGASVVVVYGDATWNSPWAARIVGRSRPEDVFLDWRGEAAVDSRRANLKRVIDASLGLTSATERPGDGQVRGKHFPNRDPNLEGSTTLLAVDLSRKGKP